MKVDVGATYEKVLEWPAGTVVTFVVLAETTAKTVRWNESGPGYRLLVLAVEGKVNSVVNFTAGEICAFPCTANFFTKLKRLT